MAANVAKRRKIAHPDGGSSSSLPVGAASSLPSSGASAFVLETEELLGEERVDYDKAFHGVDGLLRQLKDAVEAIPSHEPVFISDATKALEKTSKVAVPFPRPKPAKDWPYKLGFAKPARVNVVGSYTLRTMAKSQSDMGVDMIVVMPNDLFQDKDYLNLRYFYKRAYYIAYIAANLQEAFSSMDITFEHLHGNVLLPILMLRPKSGAKMEDGAGTAPVVRRRLYSIRIIPCASETLLPMSKLTAKSNAIRSGKERVSETPPSATPFYNSTLKAESTYGYYLQLLHRASHVCASFKDACILGRIWLRQRGFGGAIAKGGFGHFEWACLTALLLQGGGRKGEAVLSSSLSSGQLFKAMIQFLATTNFQKRPLVIGTREVDLASIREPGPVLYDADSNLNVLYKMSAWSVNLLLEQAKSSLATLHDSLVDQFDPLFITKTDQALQMFDLLVWVDMSTATDDSVSLDKRGRLWNLNDKIYLTLTKALGDRCRVIHIASPESSSWPLRGSPPEAKSLVVQVGLSFNSSNAPRRLDKGPSVEEKKEAAEFRRFWGDKAELRRYPDGSILETLDWASGGEDASASGIVRSIIQYIFKLRLNLPADCLKFQGGEFDRIAQIETADTPAFDEAKRAFARLERDVRNPEEVPLHVKQVAPTCAELRNASRRPPLGPGQAQSPPMDVVVSFEASGKWPENLVAIQRAKMAFLLKIGSSIEQSNDDIKTYLGLESVERDIENRAFLDVTYESGFRFRLCVHNGLEDAILEQQTRNRTVERQLRTESAELLAHCKRMYTLLALHNQTISTFCTRFPALSPSIRVVKQWFSSHKLSCHFNEELIELFVLQAFLRPHPWPTPSSSSTGFLRTLQLLSRWDWREEAMIIDPSNCITALDRSGMDTRLEAWRKIDPHMNRTVLFVATSHDTSGTGHTENGPPKVVATRMTSLARSACKLIKEKTAGLDPRSFFQSSLRDYDVVIHLHQKAVRNITTANSARKTVFKNLQDEDTAGMRPVLEHPTTTLLRVLNKLYSRVLLVFCGGAEDHTIGVLWNPQLHKRSFTVNMPYALKPVGEDGSEVELDKPAILAEIARIGGDLIEKIDVKGSC